VSSVVLLPLDPEPAPPGEPLTLADVERETASRLGPFFDFVATGGTPDSAVVAGLRSTAPLGGYEGLWLLRRDVALPDDRVRTVARYDGPTGSLYADFPYGGSPAAGERIELHHLHPDLQLFPDVLAALRRCYLLDTLTVLPPAPPPEAYAVGVVGRATIHEVSDGWVVNGTNGNGANGPTYSPPSPSLRVTGPVTYADGGATSVVDLTAQAFWLRDPRQILAVTSGGVTLPSTGRYGDPSHGGWTCYSARGHVYLGIPSGIPLDGLTVRAYRDAFGIVNGADAPGGPVFDGDADELAVPLDYVCAFAHIEAWRRHRDRLEASAAEGRFASQNEASVEATRVASLYADFLFRPQTERGDRIASPWGGSGGSVNGLGGSGALTGAVVNQNNPYD
jgi:hypothetical protein